MPYAKRGRGENLSRMFNALSRTSQVHSSGNSRYTMPIRPVANQVFTTSNEATCA